MDGREWTVAVLYHEGRKMLEEAGIPNPSFDALALLGVTRSEMLLQGMHIVSDLVVEAYKNRIEQRKQRYPLQYILGTWDFYGTEFMVGEGVLIPRPETETLIETAASGLRDVSCPRILDLCAGSGNIGITLARLIPDAEITCVEFSDDAIHYLTRNAEQLSDSRIKIRKADILDPWSANEIKQKFDAIVSNPPYLTDSDMQNLQPELEYEPAEALSGGADGLNFYRAIADYWVPCLKRGGILCVEFGMGQAKDVADIFSLDLEKRRIIRDINGTERILCGVRR